MVPAYSIMHWGFFSVSWLCFILNDLLIWMVDDKWQGQGSLPWPSGLCEVTSPGWGQQQVCDRVQVVRGHEPLADLFSFFSRTGRTLIVISVLEYCRSISFRWQTCLFGFIDFFFLNAQQTFMLRQFMYMNHALYLAKLVYFAPAALEAPQTLTFA